MVSCFTFAPNNKLLQMKKYLNGFFLFIMLCGSLLILNGCKDDESEEKDKGGFNLFSLQDDIEFGAQVAEQIESDPATYPILDSAQNVEAYGHIYRIRDAALNSGKVRHRDDFIWRVRIVHDDSVLNAFCTPGGYIYFYTGIIKFLASEDELAGVMGHEIAHAAERHSTEALTRQYGLSVLFSILLGDQSLVGQVAQGLLGLSYSRKNETDADKRSVEYLYPTDYDARGAARFFEKLIELGSGGGPTFLSTHPNPENRVEEIINYWDELGAVEGERFLERYQQFKNSLP